MIDSLDVQNDIIKNKINYCCCIYLDKYINIIKYTKINQLKT